MMLLAPSRIAPAAIVNAPLGPAPGSTVLVRLPLGQVLWDKFVELDEWHQKVFTYEVPSSAQGDFIVGIDTNRDNFLHDWNLIEDFEVAGARGAATARVRNSGFGLTRLPPRCVRRR